jgi:uncharacterized protein YceH (UPF0502 family)
MSEEDGSFLRRIDLTPEEIETRISDILAGTPEAAARLSQGSEVFEGPGRGGALSQARGQAMGARQYEFGGTRQSDKKQREIAQGGVVSTLPEDDFVTQEDAKAQAKIAELEEEIRELKGEIDDVEEQLNEAIPEQAPSQHPGGDPKG